MIYLSIDVGILNLALVKVSVENNQIAEILEARVVNLNELTHSMVTFKRCQLHHSNDVFDKLEHMFQEFPNLFSGVNRVLIERQPINGLVHVEQLLFGKFRNIATLISPNAMHKWLQINHLDYEHRKVATTKHATPYLEKCSAWIDARDGRLHDMADALCILLYVLHIESDREKNHNLKDQTKLDMDDYVVINDNPILALTSTTSTSSTPSTTQTMDQFFDQYRYQPILSAEYWLNSSNKS